MQSEIKDKLFLSGGTGTGYLAVVHAHNSYMTVLYRTGIIGLILYINILID